ncbi:MAG: hypothetical protein IKV41_03100 [Oscillospiraceae bacterium]|nr:hypothetical protein [Oscillospiraceae bacterium]
MKINIIRGKNQIGGNIIEIFTKQTKILLDAGLELDDEKNEQLPHIPELFEYAGYDAIFATHYHGDHLGLVYKAHKDIPIYMGERSYNIISASDNYNGHDTINPIGFLRHKEEIIVGDITVIPFLCDHSAFDSYMLLCKSGEESILYTGDFRSNGRKPFGMLLSSLPKKINKLICEGTTFSREGYFAETEKSLEEKAFKIFSENKGPVFILQSSMNIDRIVTVYRAAKRTGRIFLEDAYMAGITTAAGEHIPNPNFKDVYAFITNPSKYEFVSKYKRKVGKDKISKMHFVMCVRTTMLSYIKSLSEKMSFENGVLVYSFWSGYKNSESMKEFLSECEALGLKIKTLHTSGHADENAIRMLIETVNPDVIIPVHTENAERFKKIAPEFFVEI